MTDFELENGRVLFDCPHKDCGTRIAVGAPNHGISVQPASGITVSPRIMCPQCYSVLEIIHGEVRRHGVLRMPSQDPVIMPGTRVERAAIEVKRTPVTHHRKTMKPEPLVYEDQTVAKLRELARRRELSTSGNKDSLVAALKEWDLVQSKPAKPEPEEEEEPEEDDEEQ